MSNFKKLTAALGLSAALALTAAAVTPAGSGGVIRAERDCC